MNVGDEFWYTYIEFTTHGDRILRMHEPEPFVVIRINDRSPYIDAKSKITGNRITITTNKGIYETRDDAVEYWNSKLYDALDKLESRYTSVTRHFKKKIIKDEVDR